MSEIDSDGADRRGIAQADAYVVGVERCEVVKSDVGEYISAVVERNDAEAFLDGQGDASLGIDDELLVAATGNVDLRAIGGGLV